jgi:two-component system cell cycle response regulator DivK
MTAALTGKPWQPIPPEAARIFLVEDDANNRTTVMKLLLFAGAVNEHCCCALSGNGIVQMLDRCRGPFDLVLLDLRLPSEDGYALLRQIRDMAPFKEARVVAVTGKTSIEEMREAQRAGFDGFLGKPLRLERFPGQLQRILAGQPVWENR